MKRDLYESTMRATSGDIKGPVKNPGRLVGVRELDFSIIVIGSDPAADVQIKGRSIGEYHAEITHVDGAYTIRHLDGREKVKVNGKAVDKRVLSDGDQITIGDRRFTFEEGAGDSGSDD